MSPGAGRISLRVPATSANLGPGFDTLAFALNLFLEIDAELAHSFSIEATGRSPEVCGSLANNLILMTYTEILGGLGLSAPPLRMVLRNGIPLGMGCGSSAAALVAGVLLARHVGGLQWTAMDVLREAARREGHPDNVAACVLGGFTVAAAQGDDVWATRIAQSFPVMVLLALPPEALSTAEARAVLPATCSRADAVANVQASSLLVAAVASGRLELLGAAMRRDHMHEPFRESICPLFRRLKPMREWQSVYGLALSGAGPAVLILGRPELSQGQIWDAAGADLGELLEVEVASPDGGSFAATW